MHPAVIALALATFPLCTVGCMQPVQATDYEQAVAELGPPDKCTERPAGTYCAWTVERSEAIGWRYELIMLFDEKGRLVKKKFQSEF